MLIPPVTSHWGVSVLPGFGAINKITYANLRSLYMYSRTIYLYRIPGRAQLSWLSRSIKCAIRQDTNRLCRTLPGSNPGDVVATRLHECNSRVVICILEGDLVGDKLVMKPWFGQRFGGSQSLVDDVDDILHRSGDDAAAAGGTSD